jgi:hypothetical protein
MSKSLADLAILLVVGLSWCFAFVVWFVVALLWWGFLHY